MRENVLKKTCKNLEKGLAPSAHLATFVVMNTTTHPDDGDRLAQLEQANALFREQLRRLDVELQEKDLKIKSLQEEVAGWKKAYDELLLQTFRKRSERYLADPNQLKLDFGDSDEAADAAEGLADAVEELEQTIPEHKRRRPRKRRDERLPPHLPREEVMAEVSDDLKTCPTHGDRELLPEAMWDRTETLVYQPPKAKVLVTLYPKYACAASPDCGIASPERPSSLVEGNKYDTSVAAEIITARLGYHLPFYRQQDLFRSIGWTPQRSTLCNIYAQAHFVIEPLLAYFKQQLMQDSVIGTDETRTALLLPRALPDFDLEDPKQRRMHEVFSEAIREGKRSINGRMWAYRGSTIKLNLFDFTASRHRDGPELMFRDYQGTLIGDCWSGFESIVVASEGAIVRAACNAHARRKIFESNAYPSDRRQWLQWYQQLWDIEDRGKDMSPEERLQLRQTEAVEIWKAMEQWLKDADERAGHVILPKSDFGKAIQYIKNHWGPLRRYLDDPHVPIDNNDTEQLMKQVAIGRKNWLFAGSVKGGERTAGLLTLVSSALRNDLDVWSYIKDVLDQLLAGNTNYESLLPWHWRHEHPEAVREHRIQERKERTDRKRERRVRRRAWKQRARSGST
ncbi:MAG: hypothetical protein KatS3mg111_0608 [Pirellulaceae bacterium]|nr:MAG: hypothetical protein KatS3mg111_0608 [Pirellulaceae bacterium]